MSQRQSSSELRILEILWEHGEMPAKEIANILTEEIGWNKNTTYTLIKRCVKKGLIQRTDPNFVCSALISKDEVVRNETTGLADRIFGGNLNLLFASLLSQKGLTKDEIDALIVLINRHEDDDKDKEK